MMHPTVSPSGDSMRPTVLVLAAFFLLAVVL